GPYGPSGLSLSPKPRKSGATSVKRSASRVMTGSQVSQNSGQPCRSSSGGPFPAVATWSAAPLARAVLCSIIAASSSTLVDGRDKPGHDEITPGIPHPDLSSPALSGQPSS